MVGLCAVYALAASMIHPSLYPDAVGGFLVDKSMKGGAAWNHITEPRPSDIAQDYSYFYALWSPGQYAVPGALIDLGASLGQAVRVVCMLAPLAALAGWLLLFRTLGFDWTTTAACGVLIAMSRSFGLSFLIYAGSDPLAFAGFPFLAWAACRLRHSWWLVPATPALVLAGFFLKNSMAIHVGAWVVCLAFMEVSRSKEPAGQAGFRLAATAAGVAAAGVLLQWGYLSRGWTPVSYVPSWSVAIANYLLPTTMPLMAATGVDDVMSRLFAYPGREGFAYKHSLLYLVPVTIATLVFVASELRRVGRHAAAPAVVLYAGVVVTVFTLLYASGSAASLQLSRHYLIPGTLLLPLVVRRILQIPRPSWRRAALVILAAPFLYGVASFASNWQRHYEHRMVRSADIQVTHLMLTPRLLGLLKFLDRNLPGGTTLVVTPVHDYALEFSRTRVLATNVTSDSVEKIAATRHLGVVDNLVVIAERRGMTDDEIAAWLASFESYDPSAWTYFEADGFRFYVPADQPVDRAWLASAWDASGRGTGPAS